MPRKGITEEQVLAAIAALQARGEKVNKNTVRVELGNTGSFNIIQAIITRWRESQGQAQAPAPTATAPAPEAVSRAMAAVWTAARVEAQAEMDAERESQQAQMAENEEAVRTLDLQLQEREAQLEVATQEHQSAQARIAELVRSEGQAQGLADQMERDLSATRTRLEQVEGAKAALEAKAATLEGELLSAKNRLNDSQQHLNDLSGSLIDLRQQRQDAQEAAEAAQAARNTLEGKVAALEARLEAANARAEAAEGRIRTLEAEHQVERQEAVKRDREAQAAVAVMSRDLGTLTGKAEAHAAEKAALEARIRDLEKKAAAKKPSPDPVKDHNQPEADHH